MAVPWRRLAWCAAVAGLVLIARPLRAETGAAAWLRYERTGDAAARSRYDALSGSALVLGDSLLMRTARDELVRGVRSMLDRQLSLASRRAPDTTIVLGTRDAIRQELSAAAVPALTRPDAFWLGTTKDGTRTVTIVAGRDDRGVLYGTFALLRRLALHEPIDGLDDRQEPAAPIRWVNEWNNLDGSIERGYAGSSIFFENNRAASDLTRVREYARLLASIGVTACAVNNVNANARAIAADFVPDLVRLAEAFRPWGVALAVSIDFSSPMRIGGLDTFDPLDPRVAAFWRTRVDEIYRAIPDFAGFVLKADSEGRLGPSAYGRTHADAANVIARALAPHRGVVFYRGFVYDHLMDWRNTKNDRARAAVDNFKALDGAFDPNVILQIKNGPIDFQVREPASPLFGALGRTNQAIELQITQEYLGQQRHVCFLVPMWKEVLDFDMQAGGRTTPVKALVSGAVSNRPLGGFVGVSNVGRDTNWLGHDLAMANLYGFGRLAWNPDSSAQRLADEWTTLTFGSDPRVVETIDRILLSSWRTYERYTGSLGIGTLTDIIRAHYGPGIESSERNGWGQWHRADGQGVGMDRTSATGTGFIAQYSPPVAAMFESLQTVPDDLLLFMHHVPYSHVLKSGKTVIQHIYDEHYEGADEAAGFVDRWRTLEGRIDPERYARVLAKLEYQAGHAIVWRDAVTSWFRWISGIADQQGRAGRFPNRTEAEAARLERYAVEAVTPWETASGGQAIRCPAAAACTATLRFGGASGSYDIAVQYFDESDGASTFTLLAGNRQLDRWVADADLPSTNPNGHTSTRRVVRGVALTTGESIRIEAKPDRDEGASIDYIEIVPSSGRTAGGQASARTDGNSQVAHGQLRDKARQGGIDLYFEGDSITRRWGTSDPQYREFLANWTRNFYGWNAANFGWGGDTVQNILWRLDNGELDGVNPKVIVLLAGTNNVGGAPRTGVDEAAVGEVASGIDAILAIMRSKAPGATIVLMGVTPRRDSGGGTSLMPTIDAINRRIAAFAGGNVRYLNINDALAGASGALLDGVTSDGLHLSAVGYQVWADRLKPILSELLGPPAATDHAPAPTGDPGVTR